MKNKQIIQTIGILIFFVALVIVSGVFKHENKNNFRAEYESYLNSEFDKLPAIDKEALKGEPKSDMPDRAAIRNYFMTMDPELKAVPSYRLKSAYQ